MKKYFLLFAMMLSAALSVRAQEAVLSAQIYGYKREMVYFDCVQTPLVCQEFYTNPGEEHLYKFECDGLVCMLVNSSVKVLLQPGDSLHVDIHYEGRSVRSIDFSGSEQAVHNNILMNNLDQIKRKLRYKSQLLGCVALDIKPKTRIDDSRALQEKVNLLLESSKASDEAKNYVRALVDYDVYLSFMEYPVMYASTRGLAVEQQEIGDYWDIMSGFELRNDAQALSSPEYASLLMRYSFFVNEKKAKEQGKAYEMPTRFEDMYSELASFYEGAHRDFVLYTLLCNFIKNGQDIERADALYKDYIEKYNQNSTYKTILDALLQ